MITKKIKIFILGLILILPPAISYSSSCQIVILGFEKEFSPSFQPTYDVEMSLIIEGHEFKDIETRDVLYFPAVEKWSKLSIVKGGGARSINDSIEVSCEENQPKYFYVTNNNSWQEGANIN